MFARQIPGVSRRCISTTAVAKPRIVVLGSGWAGYPFLKALRSDVRDSFDIKLVSPTTVFSFTPLLAQAACGKLDFRSVVEPVHASKQIEFHHGWCDKVDMHKQTLEIKPSVTPEFHTADPLLRESSNKRQDAASETYKLAYDYLVISIGSYNATFGTPGVSEHALFLKTAADARAIRWRIYHLFDTANRLMGSGETERAQEMLSFAIVGGGPTGAEFSAELHDLVTEDLERAYPELKGKSSITLLDAGDKILSSFDKNLSDYAMTKFKRDGIDLRLGVKIKAVQSDGVLLEDGTKLPAGLVVWSTGNTMSPLVETLEVAKEDKTGKVLVNDSLQILGHTNVFAAGDCASPESGGLPSTAQVATQQGEYLAGLFNKYQKPAGANLPAFSFSNKGAMAAIGSSEALVDSPTGRSSGKLAYAMWKAAYTVMNMTMRNRFLVPANWLSSWIFGRDLGRF